MSSFNKVKEGSSFNNKEFRLRQCLKDTAEGKDYSWGNKEEVQYSLCSEEVGKAEEQKKRQYSL